MEPALSCDVMAKQLYTAVSGCFAFTNRRQPPVIVRQPLCSFFCCDRPWFGGGTASFLTMPAGFRRRRQPPTIPACVPASFPRQLRFSVFQPFSYRLFGNSFVVCRRFSFLYRWTLQSVGSFLVFSFGSRVPNVRHCPLMQLSNFPFPNCFH